MSDPKKDTPPAGANAAAPSDEAAAPKSAEASVVTANRKARNALSAQLDPALREAAAKAVKRKPNEVIGARQDGKSFSVVVQSDDGVVEKLQG